MITMKRLPIIITAICAVLLPCGLLFAQGGNLTLKSVDFLTPQGELTMKLTFDRTPSAEEIKSKWIGFPDRFIVGIDPVNAPEGFREGIIYQDILSDGSRGVESIEFTHDKAHERITFIAHPFNGLSVDVNIDGNGVVLVSYRNNPENKNVDTIARGPRVEEAPSPVTGTGHYFSLNKAELHLSTEAESVIRAYFAKNHEEEELVKLEETEFLIAAEENTRQTGSLERQGTYRIQVGDKLALGVAGEPDLDVSVTVRPDGYISFPIIGDVLVEGKTAEETRLSIKRALQPYYNYDLIVNVIISEFTPQKVYLLGKVADAGPYSYKPGMTLLDLVTSFDQRDADLKRVKLIRGDEVHDVNLENLLAGDVHLNYTLEPGDYIVFPTKILPKATVIGKVRAPGEQLFEDGQRLYDLIGIASGFDLRCDIKQILVLRLNSETGLLEHHICDLLAYQEKGDVSQNILIENGDIIIVPEVGRPNWDVFLRGLNSINTISLWARV